MSSPETSPVTPDSAVSLREVTRENLKAVLHLKVAPSQEHLVADNATSIAQAHFYPEIAWFRAIYADETPVGFMLLSDNTAKPLQNNLPTWQWKASPNASMPCWQKNPPQRNAKPRCGKPKHSAIYRWWCSRTASPMQPRPALPPTRLPRPSRPGIICRRNWPGYPHAENW